MEIPGLLAVHVAAGAVGLISGAAAFAFRKGSGPHRKAGTVFFVSMILMAVLGGLISITKPVATYVNSLAAATTLYLIVTSWLAVKRSEGVIGRVDYAALAWAVAIAAAGLAIGFNAPIQEPNAPRFPAFPYFLFGTVALLAAIGDVRMIRAGGMFGARRIARHLWRMGFAMLIAAMSFFLGQADEFPQAVRQTRLLPVPVVAVMLLTLFWFVKVRFTRWWREEPEAAPDIAATPVAAAAVST